MSDRKRSAFWIASAAILAVALLVAVRHSTEPPPVLSSLDSRIQQAIVVSAAGNCRARLTAWQKTDGRWIKALGPFDAVVGRAGMAGPGEKREGDGRSPSGIFDLRRAFGYAPSIQTGLAYTQVDAEDKWVDDPESSQYNTWIRGETQAKSFEKLRRADDLYERAIVVEYNTDPVVPGKGSAIFVHIWRSPDTPTAGCVALSKENLKRLLGWLDRKYSPTIALQSN